MVEVLYDASVGVRTHRLVLRDFEVVACSYDVFFSLRGSNVLRVFSFFAFSLLDASIVIIVTGRALVAVFRLALSLNVRC